MNKTQKSIFTLVYFLLIIPFGCGLAQQLSGDASPYDHVKKVCIKQQCFQVETASTQKELMEGLMFRKSLPADRGMLFIFSSQSTHAFWMKNTYIPLDIIWIDLYQKIVYIKHNAQPCDPLDKSVVPCPAIRPDRSAKYVLEINGGLAQKYNFEAGEKVEFHY